MQQTRQHGIALAHGFQCLGLKTGDQILCTLPVGPEQVGLGISAALQGLQLNTVNESLTEGNISKLITSTKAKALICTTSEIKIAKSAISSLNDEKQLNGVVNSSEFPELKYVIHTGYEIIPNTLRFHDILVYFNEFLSLPESIKTSQKVLSVVDGSGKEVESYTVDKLLKEALTKAKESGIGADKVVEIKPNDIKEGILSTVGSLQTLGKVVLVL